MPFAASVPPQNSRKYIPTFPEVFGTWHVPRNHHLNASLGGQIPVPDSKMLTSMLLSVAPMSAAKAPSEMVTGHGEPLRSRREIRSLNEGDLQVVYDVLSIMGNTSASDGRSRYGPRFTSLDEFVARHATAAFDECDQGHSSYSPDIPTGAFVTFHQLMILQLERSAEAILGKTFAMPYYNPTEDECPGGKYCGRSDVIDRILGKQYGRASDGTLDEPAFCEAMREPNSAACARRSDLPCVSG